MGAHFGIMWGSKEYKVRIRFDKEHATYAMERDWHESQTFTKRRDGSVDLHLKVNELFELERWILSWGAGVEVLSPKELRDMVREDAKAMAKRNKPRQ